MAKRNRKLFGLTWTVLSVLPQLVTASTLLILGTDRTNSVYQVGEKIVWHATLHEDASKYPDGASYSLNQGGGQVIGAGTVNFENGKALFECSSPASGTILGEITVTNRDGKFTRALAGAAVAPEKILPSLPCPEDFDVFWKSKIEELGAVPENPVIHADDNGRQEVSYWKISLANIRGTHIKGQLARPVAGKKFPAMLVVQWAGVYPLQKEWITKRAAEGWLVLNISAHDLPIDAPQSFYDGLSNGALKNYPAIGNDDREQSYFLRMYLSCYRAVDFLAARPEWDGKTLIVTGTSQGGLQSFVAAALNPKVTGIMALVPAGCDNSGDLVGRKPGWPYWMANARNHDTNKVRETSRYFDGVNFAARVKCPALVGLGLIDTTSPPSGVFAAVNQLKGSKEIIVMPDANHHGDNNTHAEFIKRENQWLAAWLKGRNNTALARSRETATANISHN
jgi:cephalosporin-C deacetylase-like acetyl esterase